MRPKELSIGLFAAMAASPAFAQASADPMDHWHGGWDFGWGHMIFGSFMMILFWGGLILAILLAVRWLSSARSRGEGSQQTSRSALDILQERFARGEIDKAEFEERKSVLTE